MEKYSIWLNGEEIAFNLRSLENAQELVEKYRKIQNSWGHNNLDFKIIKTKNN